MSVSTDRRERRISSGPGLQRPFLLVMSEIFNLAQGQGFIKGWARSHGAYTGIVKARVCIGSCEGAGGDPFLRDGARERHKTERGVRGRSKKSGRGLN